MSCQRYAAAIDDHAYGADLAPEAAAHLRTCGACAARFEAARRTVGELDGELTRLLAIEPSPHFERRVQAHVLASSPRPRAWLWWGGAAAAAAVAIVAVTVAIREPQRSPASLQPGAAQASAQSSEPGRIVRQVPERNDRNDRGDRRPDTGPIERRKPTSPRIAAAKAAPAPPKEPDVQVPPGQVEAIARYAALLRSGSLDTTNLRSVPGEANETNALMLGPLDIEPMTIKELDSSIPTNKEQLR